MSSALVSETLRQFRVIIGAVRHHFRALESACGVTGAQVWILAAIAENPGITVSRLSETLSVHVSTASNLLDKLDKAGLVERQRSTTDRRVVQLKLTPEGQVVMDRAPKPLTGVVPYALDKLSPVVLTRLNGDLGLLIQEMNYVDHDSADKPLSTLVR
jgi:DNA-binding MarR family transcriptional regulator